MESVAGRAPSNTSVLEPDLEASVAFRLDPQRALHIDLHGQLIAALEIVSPRNKDRAGAKETSTNRYLGYLRLGVHLMLVDVLPRPPLRVGQPLPTLPLPLNLHDAVVIDLEATYHRAAKRVYLD